jgi:transposase-like protein
MDLTATETSVFTGLSIRTVNAIFLRIRQRLAESCEQESPLTGKLEADESYFGPHRIQGKRGRGADRKTIVFGLLKRGDRVYTEIVSNASKGVLQAVIRGKADSESLIHTDGWRGYDGLVDLGFDKHFRVHHGQNEFAREVTISTGLNCSGVTPRDVWQNSMESPRRPFTGT